MVYNKLKNVKNLLHFLRTLYAVCTGGGDESDGSDGDCILAKSESMMYSYVGH